jgi:hypothetical protein
MLSLTKAVMECNISVRLDSPSSSPCNSHLHIPETEGLPPTLREWLYEKDDKGVLVRELDSLQITLGPYNDSYFATDGKHLKWANLPDQLNEAIKNNRTSDGLWKAQCCPRLVALGAAGDYIMITEGHGGSWILNKYQGLKDCLEVLRDGSFSVIAVIKLLQLCFVLC